MKKKKDICSNRHKGNPESIDANDRIDPFKHEVCAAVYAYVLEYGPLTCKEIETKLGMRRSSASARCSELRADGWLVPTGERREHCAVLRAASKEEHDRMAVVAAAPVQKGLFQ